MIKLTDEEQSCIRSLLEAQQQLKTRTEDRLVGIVAARGLKGNYALSPDGFALIPLDNGDQACKDAGEGEKQA